MFQGLPKFFFSLKKTLELSKPRWNVGRYGKYFHVWEKACWLNA
jgi:hypothetical protein